MHIRFRRLRLLTLVGILFLGFGKGNVNAQSLPGKTHAFLTAEQLLSLCRSAGHTPENPSPAAMLYVMGIADAQAITQVTTADAAFCLPDGTGQATLAAVVCKYIDDHTMNRSYTGVSFAFSALRSLYPCK